MIDNIEYTNKEGDWMERRIDRIYRFVSENANVTTKDVADSLDIQRTNASKDLNLLVKDCFEPISSNVVWRRSPSDARTCCGAAGEENSK